MHRTTIVQDFLLCVYIYIFIFILEHKSLPLCVHTDLHTDKRYHNKHDMQTISVGTCCVWLEHAMDAGLNSDQ